MKKPLLQLIAFAILLLGHVNVTSAQLKLPEGKEDLATEKYTLMVDAMKAKDYIFAKTQLDWLLINAPDIHYSIYVSGVNMYEGLMEKIEDKAQRDAYKAAALDLYGLRMKYFGRKDDVLDRKTFAAYLFYRSDDSKLKVLKALYEELYAIENLENIGNNNLLAYMDVLRRYRKSGRDLSRDEVLTEYHKITSAIDEKIDKEEDEAKLNRTRSDVDKILVGLIDMDCDFIEKEFGSKLQGVDANVEQAKQVLGLSLAYGCTKNPSFSLAVEIMVKEKPDYGLIKYLGSKAMAEKNYSEAEKYFDQALTLIKNKLAKKADLYMDYAKLYKLKGVKSKAREYARLAANTDTKFVAEAYNFIGDMYYYSYNDCREGKRKVDDEAIYIAAYEMYKKAGNQSKMADTQSRFPTVEEMFKYNLKQGDTHKVGCWVNETVTLKARQ